MIIFSLLAVIAAIFNIFSLWQLDIINVLPVWNTPLFYEVMKQQNLTKYSDGYYQCFLWKTTIGRAYDILYLINSLTFWILFIALMLAV